jgi:hypothetical protein
LEVVSEVAYLVAARSYVLVSEVVRQTDPTASDHKLGAIEVLEANGGETAALSQCQGFIAPHGVNHAKLFADDTIISNFENFSRVKFLFDDLDVVQNFEFHWECL